LFTPGFAANKNYASDLAFKQAVPKAWLRARQAVLSL
jgi:hypothetical protein